MMTGSAYWRKPIKWNLQGSSLVFCGSLCDVFDPHPEVEARRKYLWETIRKTPNLTWQLLTKRPERISSVLPEDWGYGWPNVWLGVTVEFLRISDRIEILKSIPARKRFVSYEPALGSPDGLDLKGIDWIIYGGETGPGFRPDSDEWARDLLAIARRDGVAFFYKQSSGPTPETAIHLLDGEEIREFPGS
jgi:protein gp37